MYACMCVQCALTQFRVWRECCQQNLEECRRWTATQPSWRWLAKHEPVLLLQRTATTLWDYYYYCSCCLNSMGFWWSDILVGLAPSLVIDLARSYMHAVLFVVNAESIQGRPSYFELLVTGYNFSWENHVCRSFNWLVGLYTLLIIPCKKYQSKWATEIQTNWSYKSYVNKLIWFYCYIS